MANDIFGNEISTGDEVVFAKKLAKGEVFSIAQDGLEEVIMVKFRDGRGKLKYEPVDDGNLCVVGDADQNAMSTDD